MVSLKDRMKLYAAAAEPVINPVTIKELPYFEEAFDSVINSHGEYANPWEFWEALSRFSSKSAHGVPYIESKIFKPGDVIIKKDTFVQMLFWLVDGKVDVYKEVGGKKRLLASYEKFGECFGELTVLRGSPRSADVVAGSPNGAAVLELDWSVTTLADLPEMNNYFYSIIAKTLADKLDRSYEAPVVVAKKALKLIQDAKDESENLRARNVEMKALLEKLGHKLQSEKVTKDDLMDHAVNSLKDLLVILERVH